MRFSTMLLFATVAAALGLSACSGEKPTIEPATASAAGVESASAPVAASESMRVEPASASEPGLVESASTASVAQ